ncbi:MAG: CBS domain-containing protein [Rhizobiaceae bacterium]|nr:CBS domain-containing protein [Rhizobiaceae bacterium]
MNAAIRVRDIMQTDFPQLTPATPIREAVAMLVRRGAAAAMVTDGRGAPVGILTEKDCFRPMLNSSYYQQWSGTVEDHMSTKLQVLTVDLDLVSAAEEFLARTHRVYPVLHESSVVGMLHRSDLFAALLAESERHK